METMSIKKDKSTNLFIVIKPKARNIYDIKVKTVFTKSY